MFQQNLSIGEIASKAGLDITTVKNVLYGRSKKRAHIHKIEAAFALPAGYFSNEIPTNYNMRTIKIVLAAILDCMEEQNIKSCPKQFFHTLLTQSYELVNCSEHTPNEIKLYIQGQFDLAISQNILLKS